MVTFVASYNAVRAAGATTCSSALKAFDPCLSTWGLLLLKCQHVGAITGLPLGGNDHVAGHDFCPLCQGAPDLCDGSGGLGAAFGCAPPRRPVCSHRPATIYA